MKNFFFPKPMGGGNLRNTPCLWRSYHSEGDVASALSQHNNQVHDCEGQSQINNEYDEYDKSPRYHKSQHIVSSTRRGISTVVAGQLPSVRSIKQTIRRARRADGAPLANLENLDGLEIQDVYMKT